MKKTINIIKMPGYEIAQVEVEIYKYGGFTFGFDWRINEFGKKELYATELYTGAKVTSICIDDSKTPRRDVVKEIQKLVDNGKIQEAIDSTKKYVAKYRESLEKEIANLPVFPMNEI